MPVDFEQGCQNFENQSSPNVLTPACTGLGQLWSHCPFGEEENYGLASQYWGSLSNCWWKFCLSDGAPCSLLTIAVQDWGCFRNDMECDSQGCWLGAENTWKSDRAFSISRNWDHSSDGDPVSAPFLWKLLHARTLQINVISNSMSEINNPCRAMGKISRMPLFFLGNGKFTV